MTFSGIPIAALDFYDDLEMDNTKEFWTANKAVYDESVRGPIEALAAALEPEFGKAKIFRPYRDVRFAADKTPYKTNQGAVFGGSSVYFHISAAGLFVAGGFWRMTSAQIGRLRNAVADDVKGPELEKILATLEKKGFEIGGEQLKRVPPGFDKEHPRAERLKFKSITAHRELGAPEWLSTKKAQTEIAKALRAFGPMNEWLEANVGRELDM